MDSRFCPRCGTPAPGADTEELLASSASDPTGLLDRLRAATDGEFKILRELGRGGMGRVYLAHEISLDRRVALKVLPPALADIESIVMRFQREARTAGKLTHPHIVPVYQVSERAGLYFFTMPFVAGPSLRQVLRKTPQLDVDSARRYLREAADALGFAHSQGVIHRDIKPENMLLEASRDGRLLLTDFGIAKALGVGTTLTRPGDMMGTPYFMSPEQCEETENIDGRSDQYSLGLVGYEMLAGRFPFSADSMAGIVYKHLHEYPDPLEKVRPDVPEDLIEVIERAIRKNPDERFPTMYVMLEALGGESALTDTLRSAADGKARGPRRAKGRGRRFAQSAAVVVILAATGAGALWWQQRGSRSGLEETQLADLGATAGDPGMPPIGNGAAPADTIAADAAAPDSAASGGEDDSGLRDDGSEAITPPQQPIVDPMAQRRRAETGAARTEALGARDQAREARAAALAVYADSIFPQEFQTASGQMRAAQDQLGADRLVQAAVAFTRVTGQFESLTRQARQRLDEAAIAARRAEETDEAAPGGADPADTPITNADEGENDLPAGGTEPAEIPPERAIASLLEVYRQAFEAEDLDLMTQAVYGGSLPEKNAEFLNTWFRLADELRLTIDVADDLSLAGDEARLRVKQKISYRLTRTGERRDHTRNLRMYFERGADGWRLLRFEE